MRLEQALMFAPFITAIAAFALVTLQRPESLSLPQASAIALAAGAAGAVAFGLVWIFIGPGPDGGRFIDFFSAVHIAYVMALSLPAAVALALAAARAGGFAKRLSKATWVAMAVAAGAAVVGLISTHVVPFLVHADQVQLAMPSSVDGREAITIGVLADIQTGEVGPYERRVVDALMAQRPDLILIAGDLLQPIAGEYGHRVPALRALLGRLHAPGGVFLVDGNVDRPHKLRRIVQGTDVRFLENEVVTTMVRDRPVVIGGSVTESFETRLPATDAMLADLAGRDRSSLRILLAHRPDDALGLPAPVDLIVSGHTHGGQIALPVVGPLVDLSELPSRITRGGLSTLDSSPIYVSTGVGLERGNAPQVRFGVRPSYGVIHMSGTVG